MRFRATDDLDYRTLERWIKADEYHPDHDASWWYPKAGCILACCFEDNSGEVLFIRVDLENDLFRFHMQFAPESEVSKIRVAKALLTIYPLLIDEAKRYKMNGIIFKSTSDLLIHFLTKQQFGFKDCGNDDFLLQWES